MDPRNSPSCSSFVVVLSDGADFGSEASAPAVAAATDNADAGVCTIEPELAGLRPGARSPSLPTRPAARMRRPRRLPTSAAIYSRLSAELSNAYVVRYRSLAEPQAKVAVTADVSGVGSASAAYTAPQLAVSNPGRLGRELVELAGGGRNRRRGDRGALRPLVDRTRASSAQDGPRARRGVRRRA